jgi:hypothetical protein
MDWAQRFGAIAVLVGVTALSEYATAAEISARSCSSADCLNRGDLTIDLVGTIEVGDLEKIKRLYATREQFYAMDATEPGRYAIIDADKLDEWQRAWAQAHPNGATTPTPPPMPAIKPITVRGKLIVDSPGGDLEEAMAIGRWLREKRFFVTVPVPSQCASACVFVLAAGLMKAAFGEIIMHRPFFVETPNGDMGENLRTLLSQARQYFAEMNIPESLADDMFSVPPISGVVLSEQQLEHYRLNQTDMAYQEELELAAAARLGIGRVEYLERSRAFEDAAGQCAELVTGEWLTCRDHLMETFGLKPQ